MAICYSRTFLKTVLTTSSNSRVSSELWRYFIQLGINKVRPTRRGCRSGRQITSKTLESTAPSLNPPSTSHHTDIHSVSQEIEEIQETRNHLHNASIDLLNIQSNTFCDANINNPTNGIHVQPTEDTYNVPKLLLSNVRSLVPKIDEITEFTLRNNIHLVFITESWLRSSISDVVISIPDFAVIRKDRQSDSHGGVCAYVKEGICKYKELKDLQCCENHEILWLHLRPNRLPRGFSCIIAAVVYHPPGADEGSIRDHLFTSLLQAETKYPNCGFLITGDFNRLDIKQAANHFKLKQIVKVPTRKNVTLDLVFTNMHEFYNKPEAHPPFGLSDHNSILVPPKTRDRSTDNEKKIIMRRDLRNSSKIAMGKFLSSFDWHVLLSPSSNSCEDMWNIFCKIIHTGLDILMPLKKTKICNADAPWMTQKLKSLILKRQKAFNTQGSESASFKYYRNLVNRVRKRCRSDYYESKIQHLKGEQPKQWWAEVKRLSGMKAQTSDLVKPQGCN